MKVEVLLSDLRRWHPWLLWDNILAATVAVLSRAGNRRRYAVPLAVENVPGFRGEELVLLLNPKGIARKAVSRVSRTFELSRLVELAAIGVAGVALYSAGQHIISDVAERDSGADYVLDDGRHRLEIAGRSRRVDLRNAWEERRLRFRGSAPYRLLCLCSRVRVPGGTAGIFQCMSKGASDASKGCDR